MEYYINTRNCKLDLMTNVTVMYVKLGQWAHVTNNLKKLKCR